MTSSGFLCRRDRTDEAEIAELTRSGAFSCSSTGRDSGPIYLGAPWGGAYFGMLFRSIRRSRGWAWGPGWSGSRRPWRRRWAPRTCPEIVNLREELERWYKGLGPPGRRALCRAAVKQPCHFVEMHKALGGELPVAAGLALGAA